MFVMRVTHNSIYLNSFKLIVLFALLLYKWPPKYVLDSQTGDSFVSGLICI